MIARALCLFAPVTRLRHMERAQGCRYGLRSLRAALSPFYAIRRDRENYPQNVAAPARSLVRSQSQTAVLGSPPPDRAGRSRVTPDLIRGNRQGEHLSTSPQVR